MARPFIFLLFTLLPALSAPAAVLYQDSLAHLPDGPVALAGWNLGGADYAVRDGWLTVRSERSNPVATLQATCDGDATFRATVRNATRVHWCALQGRGEYRLEVNNQFVRVALLRKVGEEWRVVAQAGGYQRYAVNTAAFELRLVFQGNQVLGFLDSRRVVEYTMPAPPAAGGAYGLLSGWGTDLAWRHLSLSDQPDLSETPRETLPQPLGQQLLEVTRVRGLSTQEPCDNLYCDGETAGLTCQVRSRLAEPARLLLRFRLVDVRGKQVGVQQQTEAFAAAEAHQLTVRCVPPARGCFKVALDVSRDGRDWQWVEDLGSFTVVARALSERQPPENSYFGGHMDGIHLDWHVRVGRRLGVTWARCHDMMQWTWWNRLQPDSADQWRWGDEAQKTVDDAGLRTLGEFLWVPKWAQSPTVPAGVNPASYPPAQLDDFARYVYETVSHYKGSLHCWEVWNEPHYSGFFSGTPEQYAEMLKIAYREAKRADPECFVLGGGGVSLGALGWVQTMLQAAGGQSMDGFSLHYLDPDTGPAELVKLRALLAGVGFHGPIWDSEESVESSSFLDQCRTDFAEPEARYHYRNACFELVRTYMEALAGGIQRVFYYELADPWRMQTFAKPRVSEHSRLTTSLWDEGQMLKPVAAAHAALALAVDGKPFRWRLTRGPLQAFVFGGPNDGAAVAVQYALVPFSQAAGELRLAAPPGVALRTMDFLGNERPAVVRDGKVVLPLSREPVYVLAKGDEAAAVLQAMYEGAR